MGSKQELATKIKQLSKYRKDIRKSNPQQLDSLQAYTPLGNLIKKSIGKRNKDNSATQILNALKEEGESKVRSSHLKTIFNAINAQRETKIDPPTDERQYKNIVNAKFIATMGESYVKAQKAQAATAKKAKKAAAKKATIAKSAAPPKTASAPTTATATEFSNISWPGKQALKSLETAVHENNFLEVGVFLDVETKESKDMNKALAHMFANKVQDLIDTEGNTCTDFATAWEYLLTIDKDANSNPLAKADQDTGAQTPLDSLIGAAKRLKDNVQRLIDAKNIQAAPKQSQGRAASSGSPTQPPNASGSTYATADGVIASGGSGKPDAGNAANSNAANNGILYESVSDTGIIKNKHGISTRQPGIVLNNQQEFVDSDGKLVMIFKDEDGELVNPRGQLVNEDGKPVNAEGALLEELYASVTKPSRAAATSGGGLKAASAGGPNQRKKATGGGPRAASAERLGRRPGGSRAAAGGDSNPHSAGRAGRTPGGSRAAAVNYNGDLVTNIISATSINQQLIYNHEILDGAISDRNKNQKIMQENKQLKIKNQRLKLSIADNIQKHPPPPRGN